MDSSSNMKLPGLPALPKSLSGLLNANSGTWRETGRILAHQTNIQDSLTAGFSPSHVHKSGGRKKRKRIEIPRGNLDAALALLRKEMVRRQFMKFRKLKYGSYNVGEWGHCMSGVGHFSQYMTSGFIY